MRTSYDIFILMCAFTIAFSVLIGLLLIAKVKSKCTYIVLTLLSLSMISLDVTAFAVSSNSIHYEQNIYSLNQIENNENQKFVINIDFKEMTALTVVKDDNDNFTTNTITLAPHVKFIYNDELIPSIVYHADAWDKFGTSIVTLPSKENIEWLGA